MKKLLFALIAGACAVTLVPGAGASHGKQQHWPGTGERNISVTDSVSSSWDFALIDGVNDWNASTAINMAITAGSTSRATRKKCPAPTGGIRVCNYNYGRVGWAGLAKIFFDGSNHIVKAWAKLNQRYVKPSSTHNALAVVCHEVGHTLGLNHRGQNEDLSCLQPVLDESEDPDVHDLTEVTLIHSHDPALPANAPDDEEVTYGREGPYRTKTIKLLAP